MRTIHVQRSKLPRKAALGRKGYEDSLWQIEKSVREGKPVWRNLKVLRAGLPQGAGADPLGWLQIAAVLAEMPSFVPDRPGKWVGMRWGRDRMSRNPSETFLPGNNMASRTVVHAITRAFDGPLPGSKTRDGTFPVRVRRCYRTLHHVPSNGAPPSAHVSTLVPLLEAKRITVPRGNTGVSPNGRVAMARAMDAPRIGDAILADTAFLTPLFLAGCEVGIGTANSLRRAYGGSAISLAATAAYPTDPFEWMKMSEPAPAPLVALVADLAACLLLARFRVPDAPTTTPPQLVIRSTIPTVVRVAAHVAEAAWSGFTEEERRAVFTQGPRLALPLADSTRLDEVLTRLDAEHDWSMCLPAPSHIDEFLEAYNTVLRNVIDSGFPWDQYPDFAAIEGLSAYVSQFARHRELSLRKMPFLFFEMRSVETLDEKARGARLIEARVRAGVDPEPLSESEIEELAALDATRARLDAAIDAVNEARRAEGEVHSKAVRRDWPERTEAVQTALITTGIDPDSWEARFGAPSAASSQYRGGLFSSIDIPVRTRQEHEAAQASLVGHLRACLRAGRWPDLSTVPYAVEVERAWVRARLQYERASWIHLGDQTMLRWMFADAQKKRRRAFNVRGPNGRFVRRAASTLAEVRAMRMSADSSLLANLPGGRGRHVHLLPAAPGAPRTEYDLTRYWTPLALDEEATLRALEQRIGDDTTGWSVTRRQVLRASRGRHPQAGQPQLNLFSSTLEDRWDRLRSRLLTPDAYRTAALRKASGGVRLIDIPSPELKRVQRFLAGLVDRAVVMPRHVAAFHRHRSVGYHARMHAGSHAAAIFDVKDFFGSVRPGHLREVIGADGEHLRPQSSPFRTWSLAGRQAIEALIFFEREGRGCLPQGAPTSPVFANLAALHMDALIVKDATRAFGEGGFRYSRYADDLVLSVRAQGGDPAKAGRILGRRIREQGWRPNAAKSRIWKTGQGSKLLVCGVLVPAQDGAALELPREARRRLRVARHRLDVSRGLGEAADPRDIGVVAWGYHVEGDPRDGARTGRNGAAEICAAILRVSCASRTDGGPRAMHPPAVEDVDRLEDVFIRGVDVT